MERRCKNCEHFDALTKEHHVGGSGACRLLPPIPNRTPLTLYGEWPIVAALGRCGEFEPKHDEEVHDT
jgi:hypothetical protein